MGLLDKIEDKLSGGSKKESSSSTQQKLEREGEKQYLKHEMGGGTGSSLQNPISHGGHSGSGITGGSMAGGVPGIEGSTATHGSHGTSGGLTGGNAHGTHGTTSSGLTGSNTHGTSSGLTGSNTHGVHGTSSGLPGTDNRDAYGTSSGLPGTYPSSETPTTRTGEPIAQHRTTEELSGRPGGYGAAGPVNPNRGNDVDTGSRTHDTSARDHAVPRQPYDPYSSKGQRTAADAAEGRRSYEDPNVPRSREGGVTNGGLKTGPHSELENPRAVPTAGGQKVGNVGEVVYGNPTSSTTHGSSTLGHTTHGHSHGREHDHHYGRDAALGAGAVGAGGLAGHEASRNVHIGDHGADRGAQNYLPNQGTTGPTTAHSGVSQGIPSSTHTQSNAPTIPSSYGQSGISHGGPTSTSTHGQTGGVPQVTDQLDRSHISPQSGSSTYGSNNNDISYMRNANTNQADTPLSHDSSFIQRHPGATTAGAAGAAGLAGGAIGSHHQHNSGVQSGSSQIGETGQFGTGSRNVSDSYGSSNTGANPYDSHPSTLGNSTNTSSPATTQQYQSGVQDALNQHTSSSSSGPHHTIGSGVNPTTTSTGHGSNMSTGPTIPSGSNTSTGPTIPSGNNASTGNTVPGGNNTSTGPAAGGFTDPKKLGGAYEAGYRDAVEHLRAEIAQGNQI